jgi:hypothetical protein
MLAKTSRKIYSMMERLSMIAVCVLRLTSNNGIECIPGHQQGKQELDQVVFKLQQDG